MAFQSYNHRRVAGPIYVKVHPNDNLIGLPRAVLRHPAQHVPVTHPYTGQIEHWGIIPPDDDNNPNAPPAIMTRFMQLQQNMWYMGTDWPEVQFVKHLMKLKKEKLQAALAGGEDRSKCDYVFKIWMPRIKTRHGGHNLIWRRFRVSGGMRLDVFSDKVLMPIMGWVRNYHGYIFTDRTDGAMYGPKKARCVDMNHMWCNGYEFLSDTDYTIAEVFPRVGFQMGYLYGLGDHWCHELIVEAILPPSSSTGQVALLTGSGACPPENIGAEANEVYSELLPALYRKDKAALLKIHDAYNYAIQHATHVPGWDFDPTKFDLAEAQAALQAAIASRASANFDPKTAYRNPMAFGFGFGASDSSTEMYTDPDIMGRAPAGFKNINAPLGLIEAVRIKADDQEAALCDGCGKPYGLMLCARCKGVYYCGKECQVKRWKGVDGHKKDCNATGV